MSRTLRSQGGFTLLEVMISSAIGVVVLGIGLVVGMQMQRRALFEEQTMVAQVTGRAVKDLLTLDVQRAGIGMGNSPIQFSEGDQRFAIMSWTRRDMQVGAAPFAADLSFSLPPAGTPYVDMASDVLQLYWGDPRSMLTLTACGGGTNPVRNGGQLCTPGNAPTTLLPSGGPSSTPIIVGNPTRGALACHFRLTSIQNNPPPAEARVTATPGHGTADTTTGDCADAGATMWTEQGWTMMRTVGAAYRVNWAGGSPALEYLAPGATNWAVVSRDVERMQVRYAVIDLTQPNNGYRWFPTSLTSGTPIDQCTTSGATTCTVDVMTPVEAAVANDTDLRARLRQRVREVEITLIIRTPRSDRSVVDPATINVLDKDGFPQDGFKRRTYTLRVAPRNFVSAGLQPAPAGT
ncbi:MULTISPECIES: prepilin-type N-terminal cleavage/methylation domain-containing protein [Myxococcus]|uniref:prepilin-type N-terminal cleavage/methylation domain-containing protein n=1 Tax=Myxococcus TaxID=32 RepID=UPI0013D8946E|nr:MULTISPECIES: prepilin-type N-terminal cleavage/methylation domain-containing protein [Myxococcus]NVJ25162.1 PilW family protein [Myxococcus sp. AM011]